MTEGPAPVGAIDGAHIRTFLIADVRGYTVFTQEHGDEALAVFDSARQAIRASIDLQRRFVDETVADPTLPLAVGIGLDAGEAVPVEGGYRGGALNLAARLCGIAGPGEILASREIVHLARRVEGVRYTDRGELTFKGLADPVKMIEVSSEAGPAPARLAPILPKREPTQPPGPPPHRARRRVLIAILGLLLVAVAITIPAVLFGGGPDLTRVEPNSVGRNDPSTGGFAETIAFGKDPTGVAIGDN